MTHPTDDEIMELAGAWFHTGENQKRDDGYYYRSLGTPSNVRGSDLIEFARALLAEQARTEPEFRSEIFSLLNEVTPLKAEQAKDAAEDAELLDWLEEKHYALHPIKEAAGDDQYTLWWQVTDKRKSISGHPLGNIRAAIRAARAAERKA